jgi:SAM-dependent methyltransferase
VTGEDTSYLQGNAAVWTTYAPEYAAKAEGAWAQAEPSWGIFSVPESEVGLLPDELAGKDVIELGCGTAYVSAWLARRGARPVGIDITPAQLETARRMQEKFDLHFPLHLGNAEETPFPDESFDIAISEYGAAIWCDPYRWIPEAARLLRPGGQLIFLGNGLLLMLCSRADDEDAPVETRLHRPLFGMHRFDWSDGSAEFHLPHGEMIRLLRRSGFEVEDLIEIQVPPDATTAYPYVTADWASRWPCEQAWKARKR